MDGQRGLGLPRRPRLQTALGVLFPALVAADLLAYSLPRLYGQYYPPAQVYAPPPAVEWLQTRLAAEARLGNGPFRIASARFRTGPGHPEAPGQAGQAGQAGQPEGAEAARAQDNRRLAYLPPNVPALYPGVETAQGYLAIRLAAAGEFFQAINDLGLNPRELSIYDPRSRLVDLLNVRYFVADDADTFPSVIGGGQSLVAADRPAVALVREPLPAVALEVLSSLGDSVDVEDGAAVGELLLRTADGRELSLLVRAGEHTAEWLYDAPGVAGTVRHRMAPVARAADRGGRQAYVYRAVFALAALGGPPGQGAIQEVRLRVLHPRARWNVDRLILHVPLAARFRLAHAEGALRIWENPAALPRAWWVGSYVVESDRSVAVETLRDPAFDPARRVVLEGPVPGLPADPPGSALRPTGAPAAPGPTPALPPGAAQTPSEPGRAGNEATARLERATANTRALEISAPAAGLLVISETFAPGWRAWVDGRPARVYRADGSLQAVAVPAGAHTVRLRYLPPSVVAGAALSLATLALLGAWAAGAYVRRRRERGRRPNP